MGDRGGAGNLRVVVAAIAAMVAAGEAGAAGLRSEGDVYYSTRVSFISSTERWDNDRELQDSDCRSEYTSNSHAVEWGQSYYYTLYGSTALAQSRCGDNSKSGLSGLRLGLRGRTNAYENNGSWEVEAAIPTYRAEPGDDRIGCGQFGLSAGVAQKWEVVPKKTEKDTRVEAELAGSVQLWEAPLVHQLRLRTSLGQGFARRAPFGWGVSLEGAVPLEGGGDAANARLSDCGTESDFVRLGLEGKYRLGEWSHLSCGVSQTIWGRDANNARGFSCGIGYLFKD